MIVAKKEINNVVIVATTEFPFSTASANLIRNFGLGLIEIGANVHLLITRGALYNKGTEYNKRTSIYKGIKFTYCSFINRPSSYILKAVDVLLSVFTIPFTIFIKKIRGNVDSVITYTGYAYQNFPVLITCKILKIPVYKYSVDWYNKDAMVRKWWMIPKWWMFSLEMNFLDKYLDGIVCITTTLYDHYKNIGIPENKLLIIPNFLDLSQFTSGSQQNEINNEIFRIGYSGAAPLLNGVDDLIKAISLLNKNNFDMELLVVGDVTGEASQIPFLRKIADDNGLSERVIFTGRVPGNTIPDYLHSCDILVLARKNSNYAQAGFPTKLGEYFASKRPVVMTTVGDIVHYFTDKKELVFAKPDNPESVAKALESLILDKKLRKEVGINGYIWAENNLDYINNAKKVKLFMEKLS